MKLRGVKMFYDVAKAIQACEEEPSLIFSLMKEGHFEVVDQLLNSKYSRVNLIDEHGDSVLSRLLKYGQYDLVLKHMKHKEWDINHQNNDGNTFAHILVSINYKNVLDIIKYLKKNKAFLPNIKNNNGETILDKSINDNYIYTTVKILEDTRFNNIDIISFKNLYDTYVKSNNYGKYSKLTNLEIILDTLSTKPLLPKMTQMVEFIRTNFELVKTEIFSNKYSYMDSMINLLLTKSN
ncbi:MAG: hypothetical protein RR047_00305 [Bacilli bacterium]